MGWIRLLEGDLAGAEPMLKAAWAGEQSAVVGYHLGMVYEEQGKLEEAAATYA